MYTSRVLLTLSLLVVDGVVGWCVAVFSILSNVQIKTKTIEQHHRSVYYETSPAAFLFITIIVNYGLIARWSPTPV